MYQCKIPGQSVSCPGDRNWQAGWYKRQKNVENIRNYNMRSAIYNMNEAWGDMKHATFTNTRNILERGIRNGFRRIWSRLLTFTQFSEGRGKWHEWNENQLTSGHEILTDEQIVAAVTGEERSSNSEDSDGEYGVTSIQDHYDQLYLLHSKITVMQQATGQQTKIEEFTQHKQTTSGWPRWHHRDYTTTLPASHSASRSTSPHPGLCGEHLTLFATSDSLHSPSARLDYDTEVVSGHEWTQIR